MPGLLQLLRLPVSEGGYWPGLLFLLGLAGSVSPRLIWAQDFDASYNIELDQSAVIAPADIVGLAAATRGMGRGSGAQLSQPAAVATRQHYNAHDWYDWDWSFDWINLGAGGAVDFDLDNSGRAGSNADRVGVISASLAFMFGRLGIGFAVALQQYRVCLDAGADNCRSVDALEYTSTVGGLAAGYNFLDGDLVVGARLWAPSANFRIRHDEGDVRYNGTSIMVGALWRPRGQPFRVGATCRFPTRLELDGDDSDALLAGRVLPKGVRVPLEIGVGAAYQIGARPLNSQITFGDEQPAESARPDDTQLSNASQALASEGDIEPAPEARRYVLFVADVVLTGDSRRSVGVESWLEQGVQRVGQNYVVTPRLGVESEFWSRRMRVRGGTYFEPSRFRGVAGRPHFTLGFDVRLGELIWDWRFTAAADVAARYLNTTLSLGFWN